MATETTLTIGGDLTVNRMGFGALRIIGSGGFGEPADRAASLALLRHVVASGVGFIDTADSYGPGTSEELIAEALHPYRGVTIATKGGLTRPHRNSWQPNGRPDHLRRACEASLKRLRVERIDLYQLHTIDPDVPLEDSVGTLAALQREGKIRHIGVSNFDTRQLARAQKIARIVSVQNLYNLGDRSSDAVVDACARDGLAFLPWFPLNAGSLAKPAKKLREAAERMKASPSQVALAWLLKRSPTMLPIPGTSSPAHFDENWAARNLRLSDADFAAL